MNTENLFEQQAKQEQEARTWNTEPLRNVAEDNKRFCVHLSILLRNELKGLCKYYPESPELEESLRFMEDVVINVPAISREK